MRKIFSNSITIVIILLVSGCSCSTNHEYISAVAWSDDNQKIAYLHQKYKEEYIYPEAPHVEDEEYTLNIVNRKGEEAISLSKNFTGYGTELFYNENAGYFVIRNQEIEHTPQKFNNQTIDYYILDLNGNIIHELNLENTELCQYVFGILPSIRAIPSPSGSILAVVTIATDCDLNIEFLDSKNNFSLLTDIKIEGGKYIAGAFWVTENDFLLNACVNRTCEENWISVKIEGESQLISTEEFNSLCLEGVLLFDDINTLGEKIVWSDPANKPEIIENQRYTGENLGVLGHILRELDNPENCISVDDL